MSKVISFFDGATSGTAPEIGDLIASNIITYPDDATFEATETGAPLEGNIYFNTTLKLVRYYNGTAWVSVVDESATQTLTNKSIDGLTSTITNVDADEVVVDAISGLTATDAQAAFAEHQTEIEQNASDIADNASDIADVRTTTGTSDGDVDMGSYTGVTITDDQTTKQNIQELETAVELRIPSSEKGSNNGVATLDGGGKVPSAQLPDTLMEYQGTWDASTNTPTLTNGTGSAGDVYDCQVSGTVDFGAGNVTFLVGDWAVYNGTVWEVSSNSDAVTSVNSQQGVVVLDTDDISEGSLNEYYTEVKVSANTDVAANTSKVSASGSIDTHSDVDTTTVTPVTGNALVYDGVNWTPGEGGGGSGQGGINYLVNGKAEADASAATSSNPTDLTVARSTTDPIDGVANFLITVKSTATIADYVEFDLDAIAIAHRGGKPLNFSNQYRTDANYSSSDCEWVLYDNDSSVEISMAGVDAGDLLAFTSGIASTGFYSTAYTGVVANSDYSLRLVVRAVPASDAIIEVDDLSLSPDKLVPGAIIEDLGSYVPIITGSGSNPTLGTNARNIAYITREGRDLFVDYQFQQTGAGSNGSGYYTFSLPPGLEIDTDGQVVGSNGVKELTQSAASISESTLGILLGNVVATSSTTFGIVVGRNNAGPDFVGQSSAYGRLSQATVNISAKFKVKIAGWKTGAMLSTSEIAITTQKMRARSSDSRIITADTEDIYFISESDPMGSWDGLKFTALRSGYYTIDGAVGYSTSAQRTHTAFVYPVGGGAAVGRTLLSGQATSGTFKLSGAVYLVRGEAMSIRTDVTSTITTVGAHHNLTIQAQPDYSHTAIYGNVPVKVNGAGNASGSVVADSTNIDFTETLDPTGAWDGSQFTAQRDMRILATGIVRFTSSAARNLYFYSTSQTKYITAGITSSFISFSGTIDLVKGEVLSFRSDGPGTLSNVASTHHISITTLD